ncbi:substrate-binding domain-containing protein [Microbacterium gorillae]|uniref:substrate-binding domain-containing protein n=1 Tax=Microbacterium gorillae TaxID=1231063 RepID=UPI0018A80167|nr:substrate-binding domain-containing protein [Microbacterium gorillae]
MELTATLFNTRDEHCETVIALARGGEITAAMFPSDHRLIRFLTEAKRAGLRVPEDLSVTGWDGVYDDDGLLGLTTVRIPIEAAAVRAMTVMRSMLATPGEVAVRHERLRGSFVPGSTLAPVTR